MFLVTCVVDSTREGQGTCSERLWCVYIALAFSMFVGLLFVHCTCSVVHVMWSECCSLEASVVCEYLPISLAYLIKGQHNMFLMNIHNHSHTHTHCSKNYTCKYVFASMYVCVCVCVCV